MVQKKEDETFRSAERTTYFHKYFQLLVMNPTDGALGGWERIRLTRMFNELLLSLLFSESTVSRLLPCDKPPTLSWSQMQHFWAPPSLLQFLQSAALGGGSCPCYWTLEISRKVLSLGSRRNGDGKHNSRSQSVPTIDARKIRQKVEWISKLGWTVEKASLYRREVWNKWRPEQSYLKKKRKMSRNLSQRRMLFFMRGNVFEDNTAEIVPSRKFVSKVFKALYSKFNQIYTSNLGYQVLIILYGSA